MWHRAARSVFHHDQRIHRNHALFIRKQQSNVDLGDEIDVTRYKFGYAFQCLSLHILGFDLDESLI